MKTFSVLFAEDVPHYGVVEIKARNARAALKAAQAYNLSEVTTDAEWENSVCKRVVYIEDPDGNTVHYDVPLDDYVLRHGGEAERRLCDAAAEMLRVLELCEDMLSDLSRLDDGTPSVSALNATREVIAKAKGGDR
jgi:hypothetical protein